MSISKIDVINAALLLVGSRKLVSLTDDRKAQRLANTIYEFSYKGMFALPVTWHFATARTQLSALATDPAFGYDYQYLLPSKCVRVLGVVDSDGDDAEYQYRREVYVEITGNDEHEYDVFLCNESPVYIKYTRLRTDPNKWPAWFFRLVALDIAILLCEPLKQDKQKKNQLFLMMNDPVVGWMAKALAGNGLDNADVSADAVRLDKGNREVVDAATLEEVTRKYIINRT